MRHYLGIDLGTSGVKTILIDEKQHLVGQAAISLSVSHPYPLWSEQNPEDWWSAVSQTLDKLKVDNSSILAEVKAIGLTGQMHGAACVDKNGKSLRPAILWNDGRSYAECNILNNHAADFKRVNGNTVMPGFTAPKLLWLRKHEPDIFKKINKILLPKDYIRLKMSGDYASDLSDASGTAWLDVGSRKWSSSLLAATDLSLEQMPQVYEGNEITGELSADLAKRWGLKRVKIVAGGGDNAAGAISIGVIAPNRAMLSIGTSGVYFVPTPDFSPDPSKGFHTFCHCIPNTWHQMGVILSAASSLSWWHEITNLSESQLISEAEQTESKTVPLFLPYLSGERTPHNDPFAQGIFFGITHNTNRADLTKSVLEGVAFAFADCQSVLKEAGTDVDQISVIGGGARSKFWGQILANVLGKTLVYHDESLLGPAFGAARLALIADQQKSIREVVVAPSFTEVIYPLTEQQEVYAEKFDKYRELYKKTKELF